MLSGLLLVLDVIVCVGLVLVVLLQRSESHVEEIFQTRIYRPLNRLVLRVSRRLWALQAGSLQAYLIYIFLTLLLLLLFAL